MNKSSSESRDVNFNHQSVDLMRDPYPLYKEMRSKCPVAHTKALDGYWVVADYDNIKAVERDYKTFSNSEGTGIPNQAMRLFPIDLDPPTQTAFRVVLSPHFTTSAAEQWRPSMMEETNALIDKFIERGEADLASELVRPVLPSVVLPKIGVPMKDVANVTTWTWILTRDRVSDPAAVQDAAVKIMTYLAKLVTARRKSPPQKDIVGDLMSAKIGDRLLTDAEVQNVLMLLLLGALDTQAGVTLEALRHFSEHPEDKKKMLDNPDKWPLAVEEFIRFTSPVQGLKRTVMNDTELAGVSLRKGDRVFLLFGSGSRDEKYFTEPEKCVLERTPNAHLAFGSGPHLCIGRNIARLQIELTLRIILERLPDFKIKDGVKLEYLVGETRGIKALPVTFTPGRKRAAN
jgi:cytochrome P450